MQCDFDGKLQYFPHGHPDTVYHHLLIVLSVIALFARLAQGQSWTMAELL